MNAPDQLNRLAREVHWLKVYCISASALLAVVLLGAASKANRFDEMTVERLNIVDSAGHLRVVMSNTERFPLPIIDGKPFPQCLARIPKAGETRGNLAAGGRGEARPLTARDREIGETVGRELVKAGIVFAGLDVIGDFLTEVNVTSPTCIVEIAQQTGADAAAALMDALRL